ncbi:unnamed protein product (macronuclear) [Paramecium tetraurelia]|uniref:HSF-type DNA-binding domain-containing protein n=1 Tax=Paramecium tetraurelia TaxID=5888 RepID=A0DM14_PARTE|nr:uncharacterized protein GSPATT00018299001 [Paramecium tetraurelia]CAK84081.1 unnamed protein product [Paramecium tetraurelia]|eukprot:XP_001451478.1 hypothetical protein (macronuclear) [Paramecium tetraurelia strain d4-2]
MQEIKQIPSFLSKLYEILESEQKAIGWNKEGTSFQILDSSLLTDQIMPQYFKHRNYQSFLRQQLNMYGFKKLKNKQGKSEFQHSQFKRGLKYQFEAIFFRNSLLKIKRRNQEDIKQSLESLTKEFEQESYLNEHARLRKQLVELQSNQRSLLDEIRRQMERNRNLQRETQDVAERINTVKSYQLRKLNKLIIIIQKLPEDAQISKMALMKEKILRKLELIEEENVNMNMKEISLEKQDSYMYQEPNLTGVKSPAGYSPKTK